MQIAPSNLSQLKATEEEKLAAEGYRFYAERQRNSLLPVQAPWRRRWNMPVKREFGVRPIGRLSLEKMAEVDQALTYSLALRHEPRWATGLT